MPSPPPAIDTAATRRSLRRRWLLVGVFAAVGVASLVLAALRVWDDRAADALQRDGVAADATVVSVVAAPTGRGRLLSGSLVVQFPVAGQAQQSSIYVGGRVVAHTAGQSVAIVYDPSDPSRAELVGASGDGRGVPVALALGAALLLAGVTLVTGRHAVRIARVLRTESWVVVASRLLTVPQVFGRRQGSRTLVMLDTPDGVLRFDAVGLSRIDPSFAPEVWLAGLGSATVVMAAPGGGHVLEVRSR